MEVAAGVPLVAWLGATAAPADDWDELLGGKAASLERLLRMGAPTPPGFCLTTEAFRAHLRSEPYAADADAAIARLPDRSAASRLVDLLLTAPFPDQLAAELGAGLTRLARSDPEARFAVRSSAVGEDGRNASFAGIHDTELELDRADVGAAVRRCWASLWSDRALEYRAARDLPLDGAMAVVVQLLVPAEAAAVVFTRHPVSGRDDQLLVNAVTGLGETLVSGTVTPDEIVLDKASRSTISFSPGDVDPVLTEEELRGLAELSLQLERRFGQGIDIEAALAGGQWYILQARPITA